MNLSASRSSVQGAQPDVDPTALQRGVADGPHSCVGALRHRNKPSGKTVLSHDWLSGAPVHELAHVIACLLFRMPISKVVLYQPGAAGGRLGYVAFLYNPRSGLHAAGRMIQGVAPLLAGACIARYALQVDVVTPGRTQPA